MAGLVAGREEPALPPAGVVEALPARGARQALPVWGLGRGVVGMRVPSTGLPISNFS